MPHQPTASAPHTAGRLIHHARVYDLFGKKMSGGRDTLVEVAAPAPDENVLDVGCGTGTVALTIAARVPSARVIGIDASPEMVELAKAKAVKAGAGCEFQVAAIESLPFPDSSFNLVTSSLMLHHLPVELKRAGLAEVRRVLEPGGRFVAVDFATESHTRLGHLLSILGHGRGPPRSTPSHPCCATPGSATSTRSRPATRTCSSSRLTNRLGESSPRTAFDPIRSVTRHRQRQPTGRIVNPWSVTPGSASCASLAGGSPTR
jgi:SAM-dependent methyltransferase